MHGWSGVPGLLVDDPPLSPLRTVDFVGELRQAHPQGLSDLRDGHPRGRGLSQLDPRYRADRDPSAEGDLFAGQATILAQAAHG